MGTFNIRNIGTETSLITKPDGMFKYSSLIEGYAANSINANLTFTNFHAHIKFDSAFRNPSSGREYSPVTECVKSLIRIL